MIVKLVDYGIESNNIGYITYNISDLDKNSLSFLYNNLTDGEKKLKDDSLILTMKYSEKFYPFNVDGFQIRTLLLTMLYRLTPTLIEAGKVYIAESPLYEINCKDDTYFCYTEKEKAQVLEEIGDKKYTVQRSKGLGENEPEMMWLTTMNPKTRRLIKVEPDYSPEAVADKFDLLLGDNLQGRKDYIAENGYQYIDLTDLS